MIFKVVQPDVLYSTFLEENSFCQLFPPDMVRRVFVAKRESMISSISGA